MHEYLAGLRKLREQAAAIEADHSPGLERRVEAADVALLDQLTDDAEFRLLVAVLALGRDRCDPLPTARHWQTRAKAGEPLRVYRESAADGDDLVFRVATDRADLTAEELATPGTLARSCTLAVEIARKRSAPPPAPIRLTAAEAWNKKQEEHRRLMEGAMQVGARPDQGTEHLRSACVRKTPGPPNIVMEVRSGPPKPPIVVEVRESPPRPKPPEPKQRHAPSLLGPPSESQKQATIVHENRVRNGKADAERQAESNRKEDERVACALYGRTGESAEHAARRRGADS